MEGLQWPLCWPIPRTLFIPRFPCAVFDWTGLFLFLETLSCWPLVLSWPLPLILDAGASSPECLCIEGVPIAKLSYNLSWRGFFLFYCFIQPQSPKHPHLHLIWGLTYLIPPTQISHRHFIDDRSHTEIPNPFRISLPNLFSVLVGITTIYFAAQAGQMKYFICQKSVGQFY